MPHDICSFLEQPLLNKLRLELGPEFPRVNPWYLEDVLSHRSFGDGGMINCQGQAPAKAEFVDRFAEVLLARVPPFQTLDVGRSQQERGIGCGYQHRSQNKEKEDGRGAPTSCDKCERNVLSSLPTCQIRQNIT